MKLEEKFAQPTKVDSGDMQFGGEMKVLLPPYGLLPEEFRSQNNKWVKLQQTWFFKGLHKDTEFYPKDGIDLDIALGHLKAIQSSWLPKHEHKEAGVAYLMSLWFEDIVLPNEI